MKNNHSQAMQKSNFMGYKSGFGVKSPCLKCQQPDLKVSASRNGEGESAVSKTTGYLEVASLKSIPLLTYNIQKEKVR